MLTFATSVLHEYALIWQGDSALKQPAIPPEVEPLADEPAEAFEARKAARDAEVAKLRDEHEAAWIHAIETGKWDALKVPGATPTVFWCRPIPGSTWRAFLDHIANPANELGGWQRTSLAFRLAVVRVDNFAPGFKVERVEHTGKNGERSGLGLVMCEGLVDALDKIDMSIVMAFGAAIFKNRSGPSPL